MDWVEIIEPRSRQPMYANLVSGQCSWHPPEDVVVRRAHDNQWWELFDTKTGRYYYYNVKSQQTVWKRPDNGDIIPLTKLQTMKRNCEPAGGTAVERASYSLSSTPSRHSCLIDSSYRRSRVPAESRAISGSFVHRPRPDSGGAGGHRGAGGVHRQSSGSSSIAVLCTPLNRRRQPCISSSLTPTTASTSSHRGGSVGIPRTGDDSDDSAAGSSGSWEKGRDSGGGDECSRKRREKLLRSQQGQMVLDSGVQSASTTAGSQRSEGRQMKTSVGSSSFSRADRVADGGSRVYRTAGQTTVISPTSRDVIAASPASSCSSDQRFADDEDAGSDGYTSETSSAGYLAEDERFDRLQRAASRPLEGPESLRRRPRPRVCMKTSAAGADQSADSPYGTASYPSAERSTLSRYEPNTTAESLPNPTAGYERNLASGVEKNCKSGLERKPPPGLESSPGSGLEKHSISQLERSPLSGIERSPGCGLDKSSISVLERSVLSEDGHLSSSRAYGDSHHHHHHQLPSSDSLRRSLSSPPLPASDQKRLSMAATDSPLSPERDGEAEGDLRQQLSSHRLFDLLKVDESTVSDDDGLMEKYVRQNISQHKRGLFRRKVSARDMLSWSKDSITESITLTVDKSLRKAACRCFRLVQIYMGDRKCSIGTTLDGIGAQLVQLAGTEPALCDELFVQLCRQTTDNPRRDSLRRGWELMAVCLHFFKPTPRQHMFLEAYIGRHRQPELETAARGLAEAASVDTVVNVDGAVDELACSAAQQALASSHAGSLIQVQVGNLARVCSQRLQRETRSRSARKPTPKDIELSRMQIFRPSMFGCSLNEAMVFQSELYPDRHIPWVFSTLMQMVLNMDGMKTEGIFRVAGEAEEVAQLKMKLDLWHIETQSSPSPPSLSSIASHLASSCSDSHAPASLLKQWLRQLWRPLLPDHLYNSCIELCQKPEQLLELMDHHLPTINRLTLICLIRFLQNFSAESVVCHTKMDASNLAMVFAPNILRNSEANALMVLENARKEVLLVRTLILFMDTDCAVDLL